MTDSRRNIRLTIIGICLFMAAMIGLLVNKQLSQPAISKEQLREQGVFLFDQPRIIKPFSLLDHHGNAFTEQQLQGQWSLVFFGFTFCPDICPATMAMLNQVVRGIDDPAIAASTRVVLVSVDPARDTVAQLGLYVPYFNPDFTGVTGEFFTIHALATNLNAAFQKVPGGGDNYTVDHSAYVFLVNPRGDYQGFFKPPFDAERFRQHYLAVRELYRDL